MPLITPASTLLRLQPGAGSYHDSVSPDPTVEVHALEGLSEEDSSPPPWRAPVTPILAPAPAPRAPSVSRTRTLQLDQISWETLKETPQAGFFVPGDTPVGLMVEQHPYKPTDPLIQKDLHRNAESNRLRDLGIEPNWVKCTGVAELGASPDIGLLKFSAVGVSTGFNGLIQYRSLKPYPRKSSRRGGDSKHPSGLELPTTADSALRLPRGSEVEFSGQGTIEGALSWGMGAGQVITEEVKLSIKRLHQDYVRVDFTDTKGISPNITAQFTPLCLMNNPLGLIGEGLLLTAVRCGATTELASLVRIVKNANLKGQLSYARGKKDRTLHGFVFDLSNSQAREAYEKLITLQTRSALDLAKECDTGVSVAEAAEHTTTVSMSSNVSFLGKKLLLCSSLQSARVGEVEGAHGTRLIYRDASYEKTFNNVVTGDKKIKWQSVILEEEDGTGAALPYFRMQLSAHDRMTYQQEVDSFFRFAKALQVDTDGGDRTLEEHDFLSRLVGDGDDTSIDLDVYFTPEGVQKIDNASKRDVVDAALRALRVLEPDCEGLPFEDLKMGTHALRIVGEYEKLQRTNTTTWLDFILYLCSPSEGDPEELAREYRNRLHRDIATDAQALSQSLNLSNSIAGLDAARGSEKMAQFLSDLGESRGFNYMLAIATLANLAGDEETLIHRLSLKGKEVSLEAEDEGFLQEVSPEQLLGQVQGEGGRLRDPMVSTYLEPRLGAA